MDFNTQSKESDGGKPRQIWPLILILLVAVVAIGLIVAFRPLGNLSKNSFALALKTWNDVFAGDEGKKLAAEIYLTGNESLPSASNANFSGILDASGSEPQAASAPLIAGGAGNKDYGGGAGNANLPQENYGLSVTDGGGAADEGGASASAPVQGVAVTPTCDFSAGSDFTHKILINEIAWMGSLARDGATASAAGNDEWLELKNNSGIDVKLSGWQLRSASGKIGVVFDGADALPAGSYYLLERTDDDSVPGIAADKIYSGALANGGEWLKLFDGQCGAVDEINASSGWPGGDNSAKYTLERNNLTLGWQTSSVIGGTPRAQNSYGLAPVNGIAQGGASGSGSNGASSASPPPASSPAATSSTATETVTTTSTTATTSTSPAPSASGKIFINEIFAGADGNSGYEFIELYNPNNFTVDLSGWELRKRTSSGNESNLVDNGAFSGAIPALGYFLVASPAYSGPPSADIIYSASSANIAYTNNSVVLYSGDYRTAPSVDDVSWTEIPVGESYEREPAGGDSFVVHAPTPRDSLE